MKKLFLLSVFVSVSFGQALPTTAPPSDADTAIAGTVNFMGSITLGISDLVTSVAPSIMPFGWTLLALFGGFALLTVLIQGTMRNFSAYHYHPLATVAAYVAILFRIVIAAAMMSFYLVPIPGLSINFHQLFPYLAQALANGITTDLMKQVIAYCNAASQNLPSGGIFDVLPAIVTVIFYALIMLAQLGMVLITACSYVIIGMLTLCGPLMIPFYVLPGHDKRFWSWFDNMLAYSMYVFIGSGFIFIFCHAYLDFFSNLHGFSIGQWLVTSQMLGLITIVFLYCMFKVPEITHIVFGGMGGVVQGFVNGAQGLVVRGVLRAL
jgi:hypothetical protein